MGRLPEALRGQNAASKPIPEVVFDLNLETVGDEGCADDPRSVVLRICPGDSSSVI